MSTADGWDFTVPDDGAELLAELRRHGVRPGERLHVVPANRPDSSPDTNLPEPRRVRRLGFAGSIAAEPDLSESVDDHLRGFGRA